MFVKLARELRQQRRGSLSLPVELRKIPVSSEQESADSREGTTFDISKSGIGLFCNEEVKPGAVMEVGCRDLWENPRLFEVRWCSRISLGFYRVGLSLKN